MTVMDDNQRAETTDRGHYHANHEDISPLYVFNAKQHNFDK